MPLKKILVPLQNSDTAEISLRAAVAVARRHHAHIDALHIRQRPNVPASGYYPVGVILVDEHIAELKEALDAQAKKIQGVFDRVMKAENIAILAPGSHRDAAGATASWRDQTGVLPFDLSAAARVADIICLGKVGEELEFPDSGLVEELIFQSGRPVLLAPGGKLARTPRRILVAWNGGREAARALSAAAPFFEETDQVLVASIGAIASDLEGPESAAELLRLHGVRAESRSRPLERGRSAEDELMALAREERAELIVMGAYSHSRWRELVLGEFTRKMLKQAEFPLLLAH